MSTTPLPGVLAYLMVREVDRALAFYEEAFGFRRHGEPLKGPDGKTLHGEMMTEKGGLLMFGPEGAKSTQAVAPATSLVASPMSLYVYVDGVDDHFLRAKAKGGKVQETPIDMFWGDRMYRVRCPEGYDWTFATHTGKMFAPTM